MPADAGGVHRLKDIVVEEVSLVDRAANKKKFLVVKRQGDDMDLRSNGRGGFTPIKKGDDEEDTEKAKGKKPPFPGAAKPFGGDKDETEKAKGKKQFEGEEEDTEPKDAKKADAEGMQLAAKVKDIAGELAKVAEELEEEEEDEPSDVHMKKILSAHKALSTIREKYMGKVAAKSASVEKIGAKMSAQNLSMLKELADGIGALLANVMDSPAKAKTHDPDAGDPQEAPPGFSASNPSDAPSNASGAAAVKQLQEVAKSAEKLLPIIKKQAAKITELEQRISPSTSRSPERTNGVAKAAAEPWPFDMNSGSRRKVDKSTSFETVDD